MSIDVLLAIEHASFPLRLYGDYEMDCLRVLEAADMIEVVFTQHPDDSTDVALVLRVTPAGRSALNRWRKDQTID